MKNQRENLSQISMLGYIATHFANGGAPRSLRYDLQTYRRAVAMLDSGELSADMFVMISFAVITRIKRHPQCQRLMSEYLDALNQD